MSPCRRPDAVVPPHRVAVAATETGGGAALWHVAVPGPNGDVETFLVVESAAHPAGTVLTLTEAAGLAAAGDGLAVTVRVNDRRVVSLQPGPRYAAAPPIRWVEVRESSATPPAVTLVAFAGQPAGELLEERTAAHAGLRTADQIAAVRWYPATGEVDQVYVQPAWRRQHIGSLVILAAAGLTRARDWPVLWGDGQRTALGEQMRNTSTWRYRTADLTHIASPMTPG